MESSETGEKTIDASTPKSAERCTGVSRLPVHSPGAPPRSAGDGGDLHLWRVRLPADLASDADICWPWRCLADHVIFSLALVLCINRTFIKLGVCGPFWVFSYIRKFSSITKSFLGPVGPSAWCVFLLSRPAGTRFQRWRMPSRWLCRCRPPAPSGLVGSRRCVWPATTYGGGGCSLPWGCGPVAPRLRLLLSVQSALLACHGETAMVSSIQGVGCTPLTPLRVPGEILGLVRAAAASSSSHPFLKVLLGTRRFEGIGVSWEFSGGHSGCEPSVLSSIRRCRHSFLLFSLYFPFGLCCAVCPNSGLVCVPDSFGRCVVWPSSGLTGVLYL